MSSIVKFSEAASIAIRGVILVAKSDVFLNVTKIADAIGASKHHVAKILRRLTKDGYINSMRGPTGGFILTRKPEEISFLDLYESIEGKVNVNEFLPQRNEEQGKDILHSITAKLTNDFRNYMEKQFISDYI